MPKSLIIIAIILTTLFCLWLVSVVEGAEVDDYPYHTKGNWGYIEIQKYIPKLLHSIITIESNWDNNAKGESGEIGLMQISPIVLREIQRYYKGRLENWIDNLYKEDLYNPHTNIYIGTWYLCRLKNHYLKENYTIERLLAAYNGGITRLRKVNYDVSKMPKSTRQYVEKVLVLYREAKLGGF